MTTKKITTIVLTGGPCAGKSTSMSYLSQKLQELGYGVIIVPELATELMKAGFTPDGNIPLYSFQKMLLQEQKRREDFYKKQSLLMPYENIVILFDRGTIDIKSYIQNDDWEQLLQEEGDSLVSLRDKRYDAVIHLRTAALGAEKSYGNENNAVRKEDKVLAIQVDSRTLNAWTGHPHLTIIDNSTAFEDKMRRVLESVLHTLGEPVPLEIERKFLVASDFDYTTIPCHYQEVAIEQWYLVNFLRLRKRGSHGVYLYTKTRKEDTANPLVRTEVEEIISEEEYTKLLRSEKMAPLSLTKKRICFVFENQYFELDIFEGKKLILLEVELTHENKETSLPSWIPVIKDVTGDIEYRNFEIAQN